MKLILDMEETFPQSMGRNIILKWSIIDWLIERMKTDVANYFNTDFQMMFVEH